MSSYEKWAKARQALDARYANALRGRTIAQDTAMPLLGFDKLGRDTESDPKPGRLTDEHCQKIMDILATHDIDPEDLEYIERFLRDPEDGNPPEMSEDEEEGDVNGRILRELVKHNLPADDLATVARLLHEHPIGAKDAPPPFKGRPETGGTMTAQDAALFRRHFPAAAKIVATSPYDAPPYDPQPQPQSRGRATLAMDARAARSASDFAKRWPNAAKIGRV